MVLLLLKLNTYITFNKIRPVRTIKPIKKLNHYYEQISPKSQTKESRTKVLTPKKCFQVYQ